MIKKTYSSKGRVVSKETRQKLNKKRDKILAEIGIKTVRFTGREITENAEIKIQELIMRMSNV